MLLYILINGTNGVVLNRGGENLGLMHPSQKLAEGTEALPMNLLALAQDCFLFSLVS